MTKAKFAQVEVKLTDVRLSFAHIFRAKVEKNDDGKTSEKFQASFLLDKDRQDDQIGRIEDAIEEVKELKWGRSPPKFREDKICLRDGDGYDYDGYAGMMAISSSNSKRPSVVDRDKKPLVEADGRPYSGCYVNAVIRIWAQDNDYGKRINASLEAIQYAREGEAFSGYTPVDTDEAFDDIDDGDSDDRGRGSRGRDRDDDSRSRTRGSRDDDDRSSRSREDDRGSRRGGEDDDRGRSRGRDEDDRGSRSRERDDDRGRSRDRDDDRGGRSRGRDEGDRDEDRGRSRERNDDRGRRR